MATIKWYNPSTSQWEYVTTGSNGSSSGDVVGPSSATNRAIAIFDSTTGKLLKQSQAGPAGVVNISASGPYINGSGTGGSIGLADGAIYYSDGNVSLTSYDAIDSSKPLAVRESIQTSTSTLTPLIADYDQYSITALAANLTIASPGTLGIGGGALPHKLLIRIKDNGTTRTLTWNAIFRAIGVTLPAATTANKTMYVGAVYNSTDSKWDVIAVTIEA